MSETRNEELYHVSLEDFCLLITRYVAARNAGEITSLLPSDVLLGSIVGVNDLQLTKAQMEDLCYHLKLAEQLKLKDALVFDHYWAKYDKVMERLKSYNPEIFKQGVLGEILFKEESSDG